MSIAEVADAPAREPTVLLAGNPNAGKTTLYNALSGLRGKVGNYPGVTVERRSAKVRFGDQPVELVNLPGTYSLSARSPEEQVAAHEVLGTGPSAVPAAIVLVVDATTLARGLYFALQVLECGLPTLLVLNMMDEAERAGIAIDREGLSEALGIPVLPVVASRGDGLEALKEAVAVAVGDSPPVPWEPDAPAGALEEVVQAAPPEVRERPPHVVRAFARWALTSLGDDELEGIDPSLREAVERARRGEPDPGEAIIAARYRRVDELLGDHVVEGPPKPSMTERIDRWLLHPLAGGLLFLAVMAALFQALFAWSDPFIGAIEALVGSLQGLARASLPDGPLAGLVADGVIAGVGNVVVFVPQIALLFFFINILEDSGYLARVAFVLDRLMGRVGLHGRAFIPMLSGFACAVPAILATRTIESRRDRILTMMVVPLTSCSARLPVYVLITAALFAPGATWGPFRVGAVVLFAMYALSIAFAIGAAAVLRRTVLRGPRPTLVLELPPYRRPSLGNLLRNTWDRVRAFLVDAGTIILAMTIVLWALLSYPTSPEIAARYQEAREEIPAGAAGRRDRIEALDSREASEQLAYSIGGRVGKAIEPALEPFGQDWRIGIAILASFAAREVFVSTLGIVWGIGEADEESEGLRQQLRQAEWPDGRRLLTPLSGFALLMFFLLACQCMSTIAVVRREAGGWKWAIFLFTYMSLLAYGVALGVYQGGRLLGFG